MKSIIDWYCTCVTPQSNKPVVAITEKNKVITFKDAKNKERWNWLKEKYNIRYWTYEENFKIIN